MSGLAKAKGLVGVGPKRGTIPCILLTPAGLPAWQKKQTALVRHWTDAHQFQAKPGQFCVVPNASGKPASVLVGVKADAPLSALGSLGSKLPAGDYFLETDSKLKWGAKAHYLVALGYALGRYRFDTYRSASDRRPKPAKLWLDEVLEDQLLGEIEAVYLVRDLINTPAADMMPKQLAEVAKALADQHGGQFKQTTGKKLAREFPMIHAVGQASVHPPRLIEVRWGQKQHPLVALVGKGICFDSGGLDLKPAGGMRFMKKDMGGAAHVLGLAQMIMSQKLKVRLLVLVAAAENAVAGNSMRPGDVLQSRQGLQVEIDNTDAEGRLVLADALTYAVEQKSDLIFDFATLTGAARIALGPSVGALFTNRDEIAGALATASAETQDPIWRMPLHEPYEEMLASTVADCANAGQSPLGGAITAALFLTKFIGKTPWAHLDVMGWNVKASPIGPVGGEAQGLRSVYQYLRDHAQNLSRSAYKRMR